MVAVTPNSQSTERSRDATTFSAVAEDSLKFYSQSPSLHNCLQQVATPTHPSHRSALSLQSDYFTEFYPFWVQESFIKVLK